MSSGNLLLIDSHCHIDLPQFAEDRAVVLARARAAGIGWLVVPGIDLAQNRQAAALADQEPGIVLAVGVHPNSADEFTAETPAALRRLADHDKVVAIGEIGLDYHWDKVTPEQQRRAFVQQLDLAAMLGLPVIIHSRDANADVAAILREWVAGEPFRRSPLAARPLVGVLHAFSGDLALAEEAYGWGFVLSLGGPVTFRNAKALHALAPKLRLDRLMLETDAPYLTPHPYRGQRNEPAYLRLVAEQLALLMGRTVEEVAAETTAVTRRFFQLEDSFGADVATHKATARA